jgi:hypothetical protein
VESLLKTSASQAAQLVAKTKQGLLSSISSIENEVAKLKTGVEFALAQVGCNPL